MRVRNLLLTALLIRVLSQFYWSWAWAPSLDMYEFVYGMVIATGTWFVIELAKLVTCVVAAIIVYAILRACRVRFGSTRAMDYFLYLLIAVAVSYPHALVWAIADCNRFGGEMREKCTQGILAPWTGPGWRWS